MYEWLVCYLLQRTYNKYEKLSRIEKNEFNVKNNIQVYYARPLSLVYCEVSNFTNILIFNEAIYYGKLS